MEKGISLSRLIIVPSSSDLYIQFEIKLYNVHVHVDNGVKSLLYKNVIISIFCLINSILDSSV